MLDSFVTRYWRFDRSLQDYRAGPRADAASRLRDEYDELFSTRTGYDQLDKRIATIADKRSEMLAVLVDASIPLHNNASELQARVSARRRDVSLHSRSARGARAMDIFTTIVQTSRLLGVSSYQYIRDRLVGAEAVTSLASQIQAAATPAGC